MSVSNELIPHIRNATNPRIAWTMLAYLFEGPKNTCHLFLKSRLHNLKLEEGGSLLEFIIKIQDIVNKFFDVGNFVPNIQLVQILVNLLLESYRPIVCLMRHCPRFQQWLYLLILLDYYYRKKCNEPYFSLNEAM